MAYTITNLIPVPQMTSGWSRSGSSSPAGFGGGNSIALTGTTSTAEVTVNTTATIPLNNAHIYYARVYGYQTTKTNATVGFYWPIAEPNFKEGISIKAAGCWKLYSGRNTRGSFSSGNYQLRLDFNNANIEGTMYFSAPMLIDLTSSFGAGNEPTKSWCDANIPYFSGSQQFPDDFLELENITPVMTSNTKPSGYKASASSEITTPRKAWCAFDNKSGVDQESMRWHSAQGMPQWIMLKLPKKYKVLGFTVKNACETHNGINSFSLQGSNDGTAFTTLGTYNNPSTLGVVTYYTVSVPGNYQYYRLYISSSHHAGNYAIIDEIKFFASPAIQTPDNFRQTGKDYTSISLAWDALEDAAGYKLYKDGALLADLTETTYTDGDMLPSESHEYSLTAYDADGESDPTTLTAETEFADYVIQPIFENASFSKNPTDMNEKTVLTVSVVDKMIILKPTFFYSDEIYSGEVI